ncbi:hypothetical protein HK096_001005, partial [Nowakowskiella sp. JEL0078]
MGVEDEEFREQDRFLPIANVARIMKRALPENAKVAKDAKECVQECVSEFISFVTSEAAERCCKEKRKTINGEDILWAMESLGFDSYGETLKQYLHKYREQTTKLERSANIHQNDYITVNNIQQPQPNAPPFPVYSQNMGIPPNHTDQYRQHMQQVNVELNNGVINSN